MSSSYHNHTFRSDGSQDVPEFLAAARRMGVTELGISDHLVLHPEGKSFEWAMETGCLEAYVRDMQEASIGADPVLRMGLEADFFPATVERLKVLLAPHPFDYVIGAVHFADDFPVDAEIPKWEALSRQEQQARWDLYWVRVRQMAESRAFDIAAHLDLPKRSGVREAQPVSALACAALDAIAAAGMAVEINTAGWRKPVKEAYPSPALLKEARARDIAVLINADAHHSNDVAADFDRGRELARSCGYDSVVRFEKRRRTVVPL
ncbi:MAG: histidinol-phosphatase HisJ family protein [Elusimicrobiota bacterium]|jgi:histidinol-phosphatase (PHP family)